MGKRELLLLVVFLVLGIGVYQVTAPAAPADAPGFSLQRLMQFAKAHFHGARERRTVTRTATFTPRAGIETIAIAGVRGTVVVEGADRDDVEVRLDAALAGLDDEDLTAQEKKLELTVNDDEHVATVKIDFDHPGRRPRYEMRVQVPHRMKVQLGDGRASAEVRAVAALHLVDFQGDLTTESIAGPITGELRDVRAEFGDGATLDLQTKNGRLHAESPAAVTIDGTRGAIEIVDPAGPVTLKTDYCRMEVRGTGGPVKVTGEGGVIELREVAHPLTIEAERLTVNAELAAPVATSIVIEDDTVEVSLPREGGLQLEASIEDGVLRVPEELNPTKSAGKESVTAAINGGGPLVKIAVDRGELRIRTRSGT